MHNIKRSHWRNVRVNLFYSTVGLSALSLLVAWSVELLAKTLFLSF